MQYSALFFATVLIGFLLAIFFVTPDLTKSQRDILVLIYPLVGAFATFFIGGTALLRLKTNLPGGIRLAFSATAGIAVFVLLFLYPPSVLKSDEVVPAKKVLLIDNFLRRYDLRLYVTNAHFIAQLLDSVTKATHQNVQGEQLLVDGHYNTYDRPLQKKPDLIVMHMSSFFDSTNAQIDTAEFAEAMNEFQLFVRYMLENDSHVRMLIYTRVIPDSGEWTPEIHKVVADNFDAQERFVKERSSRVDFLVLPWKAKFSDPAVSAAMSQALRTALAKL